MKTGKEIKVSTFKNFNVIYGSVNNKHSKAIYINMSAWVDPNSEEPLNYNRVIRELNKNVKQRLYNLFNENNNSEFIKDRTIVDLDIRESGIKYGKRSFMNCEMTLFLNSEKRVNSEIMIDNLNQIVNMLISDIFDDNKIFKFHRKKI